MLELGAVEAIFLVVWLTGIACAVAGRLSGRFSAREAIVALAVALLVPVVGSLGAIGLLAVERRVATATRHATP
jgi:uncharacterized membrane protein YkgB